MGAWPTSTSRGQDTILRALILKTLLTTPVPFPPLMPTMNARPTTFAPQETKVFHRQLRTGLPVAMAGQGVELIDAAGKRYIDASGGAAVSCLGHGHPDVIAAMHQQIDQLAYAHTSFFTTEVAEELASLLIDSAPDGMSHVYFVSGGSEAVEAALKMARQYFVEIGQPQRQHFIARRQSYHGNTLGALAVGAVSNSSRCSSTSPTSHPATNTATGGAAKTPSSTGNAWWPSCRMRLTGWVART